MFFIFLFTVEEMQSKMTNMCFVSISDPKISCQLLAVDITLQPVNFYSILCDSPWYQMQVG